jgi:hypothetical protein
LSGPATGLVITSTPTGRFVYWPDCKPANLTDNNSHCVAYLETLPLQEGTPLTPTAEEYSPTEVATTDSELCTPDCKVFMAIGKAVTSEARPNRYLDDISEDKASANAPVDDSIKAKNAQRNRNRKRADRRRRLREALPYGTSTKLWTKSATGSTQPQSNASYPSPRLLDQLRGTV